MIATLERLRSTSASSAFQQYKLAAEQAVAKLMPAITRKLGERPSLPVVARAHTPAGTRLWRRTLEQLTTW
jgi:hypothetical protein